MFCTQCGQALTPGARFCAACGTAVGSPASAQSAGPPAFESTPASAQSAPPPAFESTPASTAPYKPPAFEPTPASPSLYAPPSFEVTPATPSPYAPPSFEAPPSPELPPAPAAPPLAWAPPPAVHPSVGVYPVSGTSPGYGTASPAPSGVPLAPPHPVYAGFWRRFWGLSLDRIMLGALMLPVGLALGINVLWPFTQSEDFGPDAWAHMIFGSLSMFLVRSFAEWVYFAVFHSSSRQATPGQMLLGVHVTGLDGRRIGLGRASARYFASWLSAATLSIGFIVGAFTERRQTLHDMIASTLVLRGRPERT